MYRFQTTIKCEEKFTGIGLHSGNNVTVTLKPAPEDSGIIFIRKDLNNFHIKASTQNVVNTTLCTVIGKDGVFIQTIEHFMSALAAMGIDNLFVELNSSEMPIMDGSASAFVYIIQEAGIQVLNKKKKYIRIKDKVEIKENGRTVALIPSNNFEMSFFLDYNHPLVNKQFFKINLSQESYIKEISRARTFGFLHEVEKLRSMNLALGGSLDNAVVIDNDRVLNKDGLRYKDEFVRHKILDALGDLYLLEHPIIGKYTGFKAGHDMNYKLCKKLLSSQNAWELVEVPEHSKTEAIPQLFPEPVPSLVLT